jgi:hypothetical protein
MRCLAAAAGVLSGALAIRGARGYEAAAPSLLAQVQIDGLDCFQAFRALGNDVWERTNATLAALRAEDVEGTYVRARADAFRGTVLVVTAALNSQLSNRPPWAAETKEQELCALTPAINHHQGQLVQSDLHVFQPTALVASGRGGPCLRYLQSHRPRRRV